MTGVHWHDAPLRAEEVKAELVSALESMPAQSHELVDKLVTEDRAVPRLVLTGQYSSGKSTLISALTDGTASVYIDSDIATDSVTEYEWDGSVVLVDTPGVQAGVERHDEIADDAIAAADLVLFTVTVDLFDDALRDHFVHVSDVLGKRAQMVVVLTKSGTMRAVEDVRREAISSTIQGSPTPTLVLCDAQDYLRGLEHPNPDVGVSYMRSSGINELREALNQFADATGAVAMLRQPFQLMKSVAVEAESLLTEDPDERAALTVLARLRQALSDG